MIELSDYVKALATTSEEPTSSILHSALRTSPLSATSELPRTEMIIQVIRRHRATPSTGSNDRLPEDFLLYEDVEMIIFTIQSNLSALKQSKHWFANGTFKIGH